MHRNTVGKWRRRFQRARLEGLLDEPRPGAPRRISDRMVECVITEKLETTPTVLCVDEKAQIQALDRSAPVLPLRPDEPGRRTLDYVSHGTTTLFAALVR